MSNPIREAFNKHRAATLEYCRKARWSDGAMAAAEASLSFPTFRAGWQACADAGVAVQTTLDQLAIGSRFKFVDSTGNTTWVLLEKHGRGLIVEWKGEEADITILPNLPFQLPNGKIGHSRLYYYQGNFYYPLEGLKGDTIGKVKGAIRKWKKENAALFAANRAHPDYKTLLEIWDENFA